MRKRRLDTQSDKIHIWTLNSSGSIPYKTEVASTSPPPNVNTTPVNQVFSHQTPWRVLRALHISPLHLYVVNLHVVNQGITKLATLEEGCPFHKPVKVISDAFFADGFTDAIDNQVGGFCPS